MAACSSNVVLDKNELKKQERARKKAEKEKEKNYDRAVKKVNISTQILCTVLNYKHGKIKFAVACR